MGEREVSLFFLSLLLRSNRIGTSFPVSRSYKMQIFISSLQKLRSACAGTEQGNPKRQKTRRNFTTSDETRGAEPPLLGLISGEGRGGCHSSPSRSFATGNKSHGKISVFAGDEEGSIDVEACLLAETLGPSGMIRNSWMRSQ
ncbi:hypothetical protein C1H46_036008 [Malus baccata]|uniref:Uncharacterized protein n=1 Tax=Malus baccata TaxID=106549 RepID=A0A540KWQ0_MALBA|nr:hypothetical protein C1H46_036008 [Malus baccata]